MSLLGVVNVIPFQPFHLIGFMTILPLNCFWTVFLFRNGRNRLVCGWYSFI